MAQKCLLFTYGLLQAAHSPPRSMTQSWPDRVRGKLFDLGPYPVAVELGVAPDWIEGHTLEIEADELPSLDEFEDVESGEFRRRVIVTENGHTAWVYEYLRDLAASLQAAKRWPR